WGIRDEKTLPCYDRFRCAGGLFRGGRGHVRAAGLRRPRPSIAGPASIGVGTSAIAGANRETTTLLVLSASASMCRNPKTSTASLAASKPATIISLEHGYSGWKPTVRTPVRKTARRFQSCHFLPPRGPLVSSASG